MEPLRVHAARREPGARGLEELLAEEHLDARHPRIARLRHDDSVLAVAAEQRAVGVAAQRMDLGVRVGLLIQGSEQVRAVEHAGRDLGDVHLLRAVEHAQLAGRDARAPADHERARRVVGEQGRDQPREAHGRVVADGAPVGLAVVHDRARSVRPGRLEDHHGVDGVVVVEDQLRALVVLFGERLRPGVGDDGGLARAEAPDRVVERIPCGQHHDAQQRERGGGRRNRHRRAGHASGQDPCADRERAERDGVHVVEVEPEQQHVAAEQRAEQRAERVPAVEAARDAAEIADLVAQMVEEQRQERARQADRHEQDRQERDEHGHLIRIEALDLIAEEGAQHVRVVAGVGDRQVEQREQRHQQPLRSRHQPGRDPRQRGDREAAERDAQHEHGHHHREGEVRGAEREAGDAIQRRLEHHHREAGEQRDERQRGEAPRRGAGRSGSSTGRLRGRARFAQAEHHEDAARDQVHHAHRPQHAVEPEPVDQHEARGQRAQERAGRVERVDEGVDPRGVREAARQGLGEQRNRAAHQDRRRRQQQHAEPDVEGERERLVARRHPERHPLHRAEQEREEQRDHTDAHLGEAVDQQQGRILPGPLGAVDGAAGDPAEDGVAGGEAAEVEAQHGRRGLAVATEQRGKVLLPRDLVDETAEAGEEGEEECYGACHEGFAAGSRSEPGTLTLQCPARPERWRGRKAKRPP